MPNKKYFGEMALTKKQIRERIELEEDLEEKFVPVFSYLFTLAVFGAVINWAVIRQELIEAYVDAAAGHAKELTRDQLTALAEEFADLFIDATIRNADDEWFYSVDRARLDAQNETNTIFNTKEFVSAVKAGKGYKRWRAIIDNRTRDSHWDADGQVQPIDEPFVVGNGSLLMFPHDTSFGAPANEIVNCRCSAIYF